MVCRVSLMWAAIRSAASVRDRLCEDRDALGLDRGRCSGGGESRERNGVEMDGRSRSKRGAADRRRTRSARAVMSSRFPIGVATTNSVPAIEWGLYCTIGGSLPPVRRPKLSPMTVKEPCPFPNLFRIS